MADGPSWSDPSVWIGGGGAIALLGAVLKTVLDWRRDQGGQRLTSEQAALASLMAQNAALSKEVASLREELAEARAEMNRVSRSAERRLRECEERGIGFRNELAQVKAELRVLKGQGRDA